MREKLRGCVGVLMCGWVIRECLIIIVVVVIINVDDDDDDGCVVRRCNVRGRTLKGC